jgi:hypothetical protein
VDAVSAEVMALCCFVVAKRLEIQPVLVDADQDIAGCLGAQFGPSLQDAATQYRGCVRVFVPDHPVAEGLGHASETRFGLHLHDPDLSDLSRSFNGGLLSASQSEVASMKNDDRSLRLQRNRFSNLLWLAMCCCRFRPLN